MTKAKQTKIDELVKKIKDYYKEIKANYKEIKDLEDNIYYSSSAITLCKEEIEKLKGNNNDKN